MAEYEIQPGDTLSGIAHRFGIRFWQNIYFAGENLEFAQAHPDPNLIRPGETLFIPPGSAIAVIERHSQVLWRHIPLFTQPTAETCWRAAAKMLFFRHSHDADKEAAFARAVGSAYASQTTGLPQAESYSFYVGRLSMRQSVPNSINEFHVRLASGPVVAMIQANYEGATSVHAVVIAGYNLHRRAWYILDPFAGGTYEFGDTVITAGPGGSVRDSGDASYRPGSATIENMGHWVAIADIRINNTVYGY